MQYKNLTKPISPKTKNQIQLVTLLRNRGSKGALARNGVDYGFGSITKLVSKLKLEHRFNITSHRTSCLNAQGNQTWTVRYILHPGVYKGKLDEKL